jgi:hypothetical protein
MKMSLIYTLDVEGEYTRDSGRICNAYATGTYKTFDYAMKACNLHSNCNYIVDLYCDGKTSFSLCRTTKISQQDSCVYRKRKLLITSIKKLKIFIVM